MKYLIGEKELPSNWEDILQEYSTLVKTEKSDNVFDLLKKINHTAAKLAFAKEALPFMKKYGWDAEFAELLTRHGFDYIEQSEGEELWKQIFRVDNEAKALIVLLNQYSIEYAKMFPEGVAEEKLDEMDYKKEIQILSKFIGHRIVPEETSVFDFCAYVNVFIEHNKEMKNGFSNNSV